LKPNLHFTVLVSATKHVARSDLSLFLTSLSRAPVPLTKAPLPATPFVSCFCALYGPCICSKHFRISDFHNTDLLNLLHCVRKRIPFCFKRPLPAQRFGACSSRLRNNATKASQRPASTPGTQWTSPVPCHRSSKLQTVPP